MITGSTLPRYLNCPASAVLVRNETASEWATAGSEEHEDLAEQTLAGALRPSLARYIPANPRVEVKLRYNTATREAEIIGDCADRNYGERGPFDIFMSLDVLGVEGDTVIVADWKTGFNAVEPASSNGQMWGCALAACRALGRSRAIVRLIYTNQGDRCDEHALDALDLADFAARLERLHVEVARLQEAKSRGEILPTREGSWCRYCPSKAQCPSKNALLVQVAEHGLAVVGDTEMTLERARAGYEQIVRVEQLVKEARKRLETYVDENGPIDLGDGRMFGRYVRNGNERLSGDVAVRAIAEVVGESAREFEALAVERKTTKAAIERAAKAIGTKRGTAGAVIKKIRELGGATHAADSMPIGEYVRGKDEPAALPAVDIDAVNRALKESA